MIRSLRSVKSLRPGETITDKMFDDLRYGDTAIAKFVNSFVNAAAVQKACDEFDAANKLHPELHTLMRLYWHDRDNKRATWYTPEKYQQTKRTKAQRAATDEANVRAELEYASYITKFTKQQNMAKRSYGLKKKNQLHGKNY